jgi:putative ABC transport system permease protein
MFAYQLRIAWNSLRRNPGHTLIVAGGIALGVAVSTVFATLRHSFARDPLPHKSDALYYVRMDSWDPNQPYPGDVGPPPQITYQDMVGLMRSDIPGRQTGSFKTSLYVFPSDPSAGRPQQKSIRMCFSDFFAMFELPFKYGAPWDRKADAGPEPVVVLSAEMNDWLFGGEDSVGRTVRIQDRQFRVVGVLDRWRPSIKFYDLTTSYVQEPEPIFMPFNWVRPMELRTDGNTDSWKTASQPGFAGIFGSETVWIQMWVELPTAEHVDRYRAFVDAYTLEQRRGGRFQRPLDNRLTTIPGLIEEFKVVPEAATATLMVSLLFLLICSLNLIGLLLGKFLARGAEIGVRRAMGARRLDVFVQHILECELIALLGGAVGLLLAAGGVAAVNLWTKTLFTRDDFFQLDWTMAGFAAAAALVAGLVAGVFPALRVCRIPPAVHLKTQ